MKYTTTKATQKFLFTHGCNGIAETDYTVLEQVFKALCTFYLAYSNGDIIRCLHGLTMFNNAFKTDITPFDLNKFIPSVLN